MGYPVTSSRGRFRDISTVSVLACSSFLCALILLAASACSQAKLYDKGDAGSANSPPVAQVQHRLLLIGDAGEPAIEGEPVLKALERYAGRIPQRTTIVFLGDNIYPRGLPDKSSTSEDWGDARRRIDAQIEVLVNSAARGIFILGNHDWDFLHSKGFEGRNRIQNLGTYLEHANVYLKHFKRSQHNSVELLPKKGCPGPEKASLGPKAALIALDTQWLLNKLEEVDRHATSQRQGKSFEECEQNTVKKVLDALDTQLKGETKRWVVIAAHHPLKSKGPHGGYFDLKAHLFPLTEAKKHLWLPLPVLGTISAFVRQAILPGPQDLAHQYYADMRQRIQQVLKKHTPLVYAAGHDHSLQVIEGNGEAKFHLGSGLGSASKATRVGHSAQTLFAHTGSANTGFMAIDFLRNGNVRLAVIETKHKGKKCTRRSEGEPWCEVYSRFLVGGKK